jgi:hypothetical protein
MPVRLSLTVRRNRHYPFRRPIEGLVMTMDVRLVLLPVVVIGGLATWMTLSSPSDAESQRQAVASPAATAALDAAWFNPAPAFTESTLTTPTNTQVTPMDTPAELAPVDGLKISSQSWRRGGLGSKALVTFTLRNDNDYAVNDIAIACAFTRRDGSHLTDRTRIIHDTVKTKSRRTFARMLVGFVNITANQAKCSLITANRI